MTIEMRDNLSGMSYKSQSPAIDFSLPDQPMEVGFGHYESRWISETPIRPNFLELKVRAFSEELEILKVFKIFPGSPAIACDIFLRGKAISETWLPKGSNAADLRNIQ